MRFKLLIKNNVNSALLKRRELELVTKISTTCSTGTKATKKSIASFEERGERNPVTNFENWIKQYIAYFIDVDTINSIACVILKAFTVCLLALR